MSVLQEHDSRLGRLISSSAEFESLGSGFGFTEGPVWVARGEYLLFSDVLRSTRYRWDEREGVRAVAEHTGHGNGMTLDAAGKLLVCEHDTSSVVRMTAEGTGAEREIVVSRYDGKELNSPNDVIVGSDGAVYFTDPPYGRRASAGIEREQELTFQGVFRVASDGSVEALLDDLATPNGLCFSPDESTLYVNDTQRGEIRAVTLSSDRNAVAKRVFASGIGPDPTGAVDGMKCDEHGNVWVTGPGGIWVFADDGTQLGVVRLPARAGNFHWGGPSWSWLLIACGDTVLRLRTQVAGHLEPFMRTT